MKSDPPAAALRLLQSLPVRTHAARLPERRLAPQQRPGYTKPLAHKAGREITVVYGKGGKARPVRIGGIEYLSVTDAAQKLHRANRTIYAWLGSGEAEYAKG